MNLLAIVGLCCLAGLATAENAWAPQKEYEYQYHGRLMTGIPGLAPQVAGLAVNCTVIVQAKDANRLHVQAKDFVVGKVNDVIAPNWKEAEIPARGSLPSHVVNQLKKPVVVNLRQGVMESAVVSSTEETWSLNFKKALLSLLQVNLAGSAGDARGNDIPRAGSSAGFYKTMENGLGGECETLYQVAPLPEFMVVERPELAPAPRACSNTQYLEITKTKNFENCRRRAAFQRLMPGKMPCEAGDAACEGLWTRTAVTRYIACGTQSDFLIQKVFSECETTVNIMGYEAEKALAGSYQILTLKEVRSMSSNPAEPESPMNIRSLAFRVPTLGAHEMEPSASEDSFSGQKLAPPSLNDAPSAHITEAGAHMDAVKKLGTADIKAKAKKLLREVAEDLDAEQNQAERHAATKVQLASELLAMLGLEDIRNIYREEADVDPATADQRKQTMRNLFLDAVALAGTNPSIVFLKELILKRKLAGEQAAQALMLLPLNVKTPTAQLLDQLFELVSNDAITADRQLRATALLTFGTLLHHACIHPEIKKSHHYADLYGEFCNRQTPVIQRFVQHVRSQLDSARDNGDVILYLKALANLGHEDVIQIVVPYVEGKVNHPHVRTVALFSLARVGKLNLQKVLPIVHAIINNQAERADVRMNAIAMLVFLNPPVAHWQKLAIRTWFEPNHQVTAFIHTTLATLAKCKDPMNAEMSANAALALPLAKPIRVGLQYSQNLFFSQYLDNLKLGVFQVLSWVNDQDSAFPHSFLYRDTHQMGPLRFNVHHLSIFAYGVEEVFAQLYQSLAPDRQLYGEDIYRKEASPSLEKIKQLLQIQPRDAASALKAQGSLTHRLMGEVERFFFFDKDTIRQMTDELSALKHRLQAGIPINYQKAASLADIAIMFPSEMGMPHVVTIKMPVVASVRGNLRLEASNPVANIRPLVNVEMIAHSSLVSTFTNEVLTAGVEKHLNIHVPIEAQIRGDKRSGKATVSIKPAGAARQIQMLHFHTKPFAARRDITDFRPATTAPDARIIMVNQQPAQREYAFGDTLLGLRFAMTQKLDQHVADFASIYREIRQYSLAPLTHFWWTNPSVHMHQYTVVLDKDYSSTKEIEAELTIGIASKYKSIHKQDIYADHTVKDSIEKALAKLDAGTVVTVAAQLRMKGRSVRQYSASVTAGAGNVGLQQKLNIHVEREPIPSYDSNKFQLCVDGKLNFPRVSILNRNALSSADLSSALEANIGFGETCDRNRIDVTGHISRSREAAQAVTSSQAAAKCKREEAQGIRYSYDCRQAKLQAAAMNHYDIQIKYHRDLPAYIVNQANYAEVLLKAALWPSLSEEVAGVRNNDHEVRIKVNVKLDQEAADVTILKPTVNTFFHNVKVPVGINGIYGLNVRHSILQQGLDELGAGQFHPVCTLQKDFVDTFERKKFQYPLNDCHHVLLQDCSSSGSNVAVLAKKVSDKKAVLAILGDKKVEIIPEGSYFSSASLKVKVNGQDIQVSEDKPAAVMDNRDQVIAEIKAIGDGAIMVQSAPYRLQIVADGDAVIVKASHLYRNRVCGLCGDLRGSRTANLKSPQQCLLSSGRLLAYSYMVKEDCSANIPHDERAKLDQEQQRCIKDEPSPTKIRGVLSRSAVPCTIFRHLIQDINGQKCVSKVPVPQCSQSCRATGTKPKELHFHCLTPGRQADYIIKKVEQGEVVKDLKYQPAHEKRQVSLPDGCTA